MLVDKNGNISVITQEKATLVSLNARINAIYNEIANDNIVIVLNSLNGILGTQVSEFLQLSNTHRAANHSFVIVSNQVNIDNVSDSLVIVPTLKEAYDLIEMEEMERDLGF
ncbi:MAG: ribonuclease Z [Flavobacteriaceae bacterium]|nr:ribonuclease Z [Flavobacteriaceae bacterium]